MYIIASFNAYSIDMYVCVNTYNDCFLNCILKTRCRVHIYAANI